MGHEKGYSKKRAALRPLFKRVPSPIYCPTACGGKVVAPATKKGGGGAPFGPEGCSRLRRQVV